MFDASPTLPTIPTTHGAHLASHLKECSSAPRQPQGEVDGRIAATVVQAHLAPGRQKEENHLLRPEGLNLCLPVQ